MILFSPSTPPLRAGLLTVLGMLATAGAARAQTPATFAAVRTYPVGFSTFVQGVAVADVNGDGRPDLVTANHDSTEVGVLLGQASGGFAAITTYSTNSSFPYTYNPPTAVAVADVNGDGRADIIASNDGNTAGVLLGQAGGGFAAVNIYPTGPVGNSSQGLAIADVNVDGRLDIVSNNSYTNTVGVLLGQASGGFAPVITYQTGPTSVPVGVAVADVNGDGRPDLVTANHGNNTVGVLLGQAGGGFAPAITYPTGPTSAPASVAVADMNGDGRPDIIAASYDDNTVGVLLGQAGGGFAAVSTYAAGPARTSTNRLSGMAVADMNGDGRPDIISSITGSNLVGVLLGQAGGGFAAVSTYSNGVNNSPYALAVADANGDGRPDIVTAIPGTFSVGVLLNTGTFTPLAAAPGAEVVEVSLFPNPARGSFTVQLPAAWGAVLARTELLNALGQVVRQQTAALVAGSPHVFATDGLAPGVYTLRLQAGAHTLAKRVVLE
jgi:hypothetical protein